MTETFHDTDLLIAQIDRVVEAEQDDKHERDELDEALDRADKIDSIF